MKKYGPKDKICVDCNIKLYKKIQTSPWFSEQLRAKDTLIDQLLKVCDFLLKDKKNVPKWVYDIVNFDTKKKRSLL